jgi:hypothetical protein
MVSLSQAVDGSSKIYVVDRYVALPEIAGQEGFGLAPMWKISSPPFMMAVCSIR